MGTSRRDDHTAQLSRELKDAENKLHVLEVGASSMFISTITAPTSDPIRTPNVVSTPLSAHNCRCNQPFP